MFFKTERKVGHKVPKKQKMLNGKGDGVCPTCGAELHGPRPKQSILRNTMKKCVKTGCGKYGCRYCMERFRPSGQWQHINGHCIRLRFEEAQS